MHYVVIDSGKPATWRYHNVPRHSFNNHKYDTLEKAIDYVRAWLGDTFSPLIPPGWKGERIYYISGYYVEILERP